MMLLRMLAEILWYSFGVKTNDGAEQPRGDEGKVEQKKSMKVI